MLETDDVQEAKACYEQAVLLKPSASAFIRLARLELENSEHEAAIRHLMAANDCAPDETEQTLIDGYMSLAKQTN